VTCWGSFVYFVRSVVVDLAGANFHLFVVNHICRMFRYGCTCVLAIFVLLCLELMVISSTYEAMLMSGGGVGMLNKG
jgi:hypothetical protein